MIKHDHTVNQTEDVLGLYDPVLVNGCHLEVRHWGGQTGVALVAVVSLVFVHRFHLAIRHWGGQTGVALVVVPVCEHYLAVRHVRGRPWVALITVCERLLVVGQVEAGLGLPLLRYLAQYLSVNIFLQLHRRRPDWGCPYCRSWPSTCLRTSSCGWTGGGWIGVVLVAVVGPVPVCEHLLAVGQVEAG